MYESHTSGSNVSPKKDVKENSLEPKPEAVDYGRFGAPGGSFVPFEDWEAEKLPPIRIQDGSDSA